jgi:hypothetical protein
MDEIAARSQRDEAGAVVRSPCPSEPTAMATSDILLDRAMAKAAASGAVMHERFPIKLYFVLEQVEKAGLSHIISWMPRKYITIPVSVRRSALPGSNSYCDIVS